MERASPDDAQKRGTESAKASELALRQLTDMSSQAQLLKGDVSSLKTQVSECIKAGDNTNSSATKQGRLSRMLEARVGLLEVEQASQKRKELTGCNIEVVHRKVPEANGDIKELNRGMGRDTFGSYASILHNADQSLLAVNNRLKKV